MRTWGRGIIELEKRQEESGSAAALSASASARSRQAGVMTRVMTRGMTLCCALSSLQHAQPNAALSSFWGWRTAWPALRPCTRQERPRGQALRHCRASGHGLLSLADACLSIHSPDTVDSPDTDRVVAPRLH